MFLLDALLNATIYGGIFYIAVTAIIYAVNWTESRIKLERGVQTPAAVILEQTPAAVKSHAPILEQTPAAAKPHTPPQDEPESLVKLSEAELVTV